ncbi:putative late blight resistance protein-like protein R1B-23 [Forsythia ovata]|uniref:Late blight resistance protein-like protein R1B-23 n=1 Tax=Forsythia ovata TaxID=205694 RepID=A0ABD1WNM5_9LAMI
MSPDVSLEGKRWDTSEGEFLELKFLELDGVQISQWNASSDHFPKLERLVLRKCHHLKNIPSSLGDISTLVMIEEFCHKTTELPLFSVSEKASTICRYTDVNGESKNDL